MRRTRWGDVAAIAVAILVITGLGFVLRPQSSPTTSTPAQSQAADRSEPPAKARPMALFIADSYTSGSGLQENFYGCMAAVRMGWLCNVSAQPGTGYISGGSANRFELSDGLGPTSSFAERLNGLSQKYRPDVVILDGGRYDTFAPFGFIFQAMSAMVADVHRTWPAAKIGLIRPRFLDRPADDLGFDDEFIDKIREKTADQDLVILDPLSRFIGTDTKSMMAAEGRLPNQQGSVALSVSLVDWLSDNGFASTT